MTLTDAPSPAKLTLNDAVIAAAQTTPEWLTTARDAFSNAYAVNCALAAVGMLVLAAVAKRVLG